MSDRRFQQTSQSFASDLAALRDDVANLTNSVSDLLRQRAGEAADQASGFFGRARSQAASRAADARDEFVSRAYDARDTLQDRVGSWGADVETKIERNPLTAVVVAGIAGLVLGLMSRSL